MKIVIIAGGKGTRLGKQDLPKPMIQLNGKPVLEHQIDLAIRYGFGEFLIMSGYKSEIIFDYFGDGKKWGVNIQHFCEKEPLGTSGSVKQIENILYERFMVFYGDTIMDIDLSQMLKFDQESVSLGTLLVHPNDHPYDSDLVETNDKNEINKFHRKPHDEKIFRNNLVNAALYILSPKIFEYIPAGIKSDFGRDIFPSIIERGLPLRAYRTAEYIKDMGTPERIEKISQDLASGKVARLNKINKRKAIFLDRDGVINKEVGNLSNIDDFELLPDVSKAIKLINKSEYLCIIVTNQPVVAKGFCTMEVVQSVHKKMDHLLGLNGAFIDGIYFCPHHPDKGFKGEIQELKIECSCRKPGIGMIKQAVKDFNIDLEQSYLIGDSTSDIKTARNAGVESVLVLSGYGGKDGKYLCNPDYTFDNLYNAISFLLRININLSAQKIIESIFFLARIKQRLIITVGGLSRSGKSTFVNYLRRKLIKSGLSTEVVNLDDWILPSEQRRKEMSVRDRYQYEEIETDLKNLLNNNVVLRDIYDPLSRSLLNDKKEISLQNFDILFIDGVIALDHPFLNDLASFKVFINVDENVRMKRFFEFYTQKGLSEEQINSLIIERNLDEVPIINSSKENANEIITFNL